MPDGIYLSPRVLAPDANSCNQFARTTGFGTTGVVITNKPGRVYAVTFVNKSATAYYAQIHNKAFAPVATDIPVWEDVLPASSSVTIDFGVGGLYCSLGASLGLSSAAGVLTVAAGDNAVAYALTMSKPAPPTITLVTAATGTSAGGTAVTLTGTGFGGATAGTIGGVAVTSFVVVSDTSITCVTGAHAAGLVDAQVTGVGSSGIGIGRGLFTYT